MQVLIIGGTGLISRGIVKHLRARGAVVTVFNRGQRENTLPADVKQIHGDRNQFNEFEQAMMAARFDVIIDMVCFGPEQAAAAAGVFGGRCQQYIFCSTACTYGVKMPPGVLIDESFPPEPISEYGRNKLACERIFRQMHQEGLFNVTIIRPSHTYGPGAPLIDNLEADALAWDRIERGLPVLCAGDGLGLWQSTHRDDCGKLFAYAALNPRTYGQQYNATRDEILTWRDYHRHVAAALGKPAQLVFMPAAWIVHRDPQRFGLLREITQFHGAYDSSKARRDVPEFRCEIDLPHGAAETLADVRRRNAWRDSAADSLYQSMVDEALATGIEPVPA